MMKLLRLGLLLISFATGSYASPETPTKQPPVGPLTGHIWDKSDFISRLPTKTWVFPHASRIPDLGKSKEELDAALTALGETGGVEFIMLPAGGGPPTPKKTVKPDYPFELRRKEISGRAIFLVLVGTSGKAEALYCTESKEKAFATAGAASLVRWSFTPGEVDGIKVPVLVMIPMVFTVNSVR